MTFDSRTFLVHVVPTCLVMFLMLTNFALELPVQNWKSIKYNGYMYVDQCNNEVLKNECITKLNGLFPFFLNIVRKCHEHHCVKT